MAKALGRAAWDAEVKASGARALSHVNQVAMEQAKTRGARPSARAPSRSYSLKRNKGSRRGEPQHLGPLFHGFVGPA